MIKITIISYTGPEQHWPAYRRWPDENNKNVKLGLGGILDRSFAAHTVTFTSIMLFRLSMSSR